MKKELKRLVVEKTSKLAFALSISLLCILLLIPSINGQSQINFPQTTNSSSIPTTQNSTSRTYYNTELPRVYSPSSADQQQSVYLLSNVVGLNLSSYMITFDGEKSNDYFGRPQNTVEYCLASQQGSMRAAYSFINNKLHQIYISDWTGSLSLNQEPSNELETTKGFLQNYQALTGNAFYGTLRSMLTDVKSNENITKTEGNVQLQVSVSGQASVNYIWTYVDQNGIIAQSKDIVLSYDHGRLQSFLDNWDLYKISGTPKISQEEAITTALSAIQNFSYDVTTADGNVTVSGFKAHVVTDLALSYLNEFGAQARDKDAFTLYPSWYVPLGFDKVYPGGATGAVVRVWADNGQVSSVNPMIYSADNGDISATNNISTSGIANLEMMSSVLLATLVLGLTVTCFMYASRYRRFTLRSWKTLPLCGLIVFSLLVTAVPAVSAYPNSKAEVYASYWGQPTQEQTAASTLTSSIQSYFSSVGYDTGRYSGTDTSSIVYANIQYDQQNYNRVAIFHFGHMAGAGAYHSSDSSTVTWQDVYSHTNGYTDKHYFAMIWVCNSADTEPYPWAPDVNKMARSWTHRDNLAPNGFQSPDGTPDCYIGFDWMSPSLTWSIYNTTTVTGYNFIDKFYWYALVQGGYSVHDALNQAAEATFGVPLDQTQLLTGAYSYYPGDEEHPPDDYFSRMEIYGNSNIYLRQYYPYIYVQSTAYGQGAANNPTYLLGSGPDGSYTQLWGGNPYDGGQVVSMMTGSLGSGGGYSRGHIYIYGYSVSGYYSHLYVYVSNTNNNDWRSVNNFYVSSSTPGWIDVGTASDFKYIAVVGYDDSGWSCNLMVDAIRVIP